jgi:hypothetical protein
MVNAIPFIFRNLALFFLGRFCEDNDDDDDDDEEDEDKDVEDDGDKDNVFDSCIRGTRLFFAFGRELSFLAFEGRESSFFRSEGSETR